MAEDRLQHTESIRALAVGRLVPVKNFELLLQAWKDIGIPLDIVGDGPLKAQLGRLIEANQLSDRVSLLGHQHDVLNRMEEAEIVVVPSLREGFGYVTLEALQARCVVVSTRCGVAEDLLPAKYLVETEARAIAKAIGLVIDNLAAVQQDFESIWLQSKQMTVARMIDETIMVYEGLVGELGS